MFQGDGGAIKFDPACRDYNLETLTTNADCARRVAAGEPAPALAIAVHTIQQLPEKRTAAIQLLERTAASSNHPAVHYLLGSVLANAEKFAPDYSRAVKHLSYAAEHGNPAAADLLARLLVAGKGTARDIPRAIALYQAAAENGFPSAAIELGKLYLAGRHLPKDEVQGRAWLDAAAATGDPLASRLAMMAAMDDKVSNFQLIPASTPAKVKAVRYGTFDNPEIPPGFGFDTNFQQVYRAPFQDVATLKRLETGKATLPTPYLYELARRLSGNDPEKSMRTYLVAKMRMTYDASRCGDPAALEAVNAWDLLVSQDMRFLLTGGAPSPSTVQAALDEEARLPANSEPWWVCRSGMAEMSAALEGKAGPLQLKPVAEWPKLRQEARMAVASAYPPAP